MTRIYPLLLTHSPVLPLTLKHQLFLTHPNEFALSYTPTFIPTLTRICSLSRWHWATIPMHPSFSHTLLSFTRLDGSSLLLTYTYSPSSTLIFSHTFTTVNDFPKASPCSRYKIFRHYFLLVDNVRWKLSVWNISGTWLYTVKWITGLELWRMSRPPPPPAHHQS